jgi:hypothetical protein
VDGPGSGTFSAVVHQCRGQVCEGCCTDTCCIAASSGPNSPPCCPPPSGPNTQPCCLSAPRGSNSNICEV